MFKTFFLTFFLFSSISYAHELSAALYNIAPWGDEDSSGHILGIQKDIIDIISKDMGIPIKMTLYPYKRMLKTLESGEDDFGIFYRSKKSEIYAEPLARWGELWIIVLPKKNTSFKNYSDLYKRVVGVRLGGKFNEKFDNDKKIPKKSCLNYADCIKRLKEQRIDGVIGTAATLFYELEKQNFKSNDFGEPFFIGKKEDWLHFSKKSKNKKFKKKLKESVERNVKNGKFNEVFSKYLPAKWRHK